MRKFSLLLIALSVWAVALADNPTTPPPSSGVPVPICPPTTIPQPLSLNSNIEATYFDGVLTIVFNRDLGVSDIVVTNIVNGDQWYDTVYGVGATSLVLDGDAGEYQIIIYTDCGEYTGAFVI